MPSFLGNGPGRNRQLLSVLHSIPITAEYNRIWLRTGTLTPAVALANRRDGWTAQNLRR
jgi:hypothetical protein